MNAERHPIAIGFVTRPKLVNYFANLYLCFQVIYLNYCHDQISNYNDFGVIPGV